MPDTHISTDDLYLYAEREMTEAEQGLLDEHLDSCEECALAVVMHRELREMELHEARATAPAGTEMKSWLGALTAGAAAFAAATASAFPMSPQHHLRPAFGQDDGAANDSMPGYENAPTHFGLPADRHISAEVRQSHDDTCAIQCQHLILDRFGKHTSEDTLVREAEVRGIYAPGSGTRPEDLGKLLEAHGIPVHRELHANVYNLSNELAQGHQVMVGIDADALWHRNSLVQSLLNELGLGQANHAVIVSGIDTSDPDHVKVNITDPGTGHVAKQYEFSEFLHAWHASDFCMVATTDPVPSYHSEMEHFDYHTGHIPMVGDAPYDFIHAMTYVAHEDHGSGMQGELEHLFLEVVSGRTSMASLQEHHGEAPDGVHALVAHALQQTEGSGYGPSHDAGDDHHASRHEHHGLHGHGDFPTDLHNETHHGHEHIGENHGTDHLLKVDSHHGTSHDSAHSHYGDDDPDQS